MGYKERLFPDGPEPQFSRGLPDIEYHVLLDCGALQVSQQAHEAYGLTPLTPNNIAGPLNDPLPREKANDIGVNIVLLGPIESVLTDTYTSESGLDVGVGGELGKNIINLAINFGQSAAEALEILDAGRTEHSEWDEDDADTDDLQDAHTCGEAPGLDKVAQAYAGDLADAVQSYVTEYAEHLLRRREVDEAVTEQACLGGISVIGACAVLALDGIYYGHTSTAGGIISLGILGSVFVKAHLDWRRFAAEEPMFTEARRHAAYELAQHVGSSVLKIYSCEGFAETMNSLLRDLNKE